jgi:glutamyl-tRNA(Gln) amidotransferase subunit E
MSDESFFIDIGLKVGLELHQQLDTSRKLYCHCPTIISDDDPDGSFIRRLRPTRSEMGEVDPAALFEFQRKRRFQYEYYDNLTCLVESDEEPPHDMCDEAIDICLTVSNFLNSVPLDEIHSMRKLVIDGSNTSGFQRTSIIALGGSLKVNEKEIGIQTIGLEEDAARKISEDDKKKLKTYRLDRLGIPLIEVATAPDINTPKEAEEVALAIGLLLRSTGKVKRGLGTIRQDINVSIKGGAIMEIKGLQQLDLLAATVEYEAVRQHNLLKICSQLAKRGINSETITKQSRLIDITNLLINSKSKVIQKAIKTGGKVYGVKLAGFAGLVGFELQPNRRFGTELSDYAKFWGDVGGIFHTDELPNYGITEDDILAIRKSLKAKEDDAVIIVASSETKCIDALTAVVKRAAEATIGVPAETRTPLPEGCSKYARPRPGAKRMYPETDVRPVKLTDTRLKHIKRNMPERLEKKEKRFIKEYGLSVELSSQIVRSLYLELFEEIIQNFDVSPTLVAATLENTIVSLHRDGVSTENVKESHFLKLFELESSGKLSSDAIPEILKYLAEHPESDVESAIKRMGLEKIDSAEIESIIHKIVQDRIDFVREQGENSIGGLMGAAMKELRGKADGKTVKDLITSEVKRILSE